MNIRLNLLVFQFFLLAFWGFGKDELTLVGRNSSLKCFSKNSSKSFHNFLYHDSRSHKTSPITMKNPDFNRNYSCYETITPNTFSLLESTAGCDSQTCIYGFCDNSNRCFCRERFTTFEPKNSSVECNYFQKSRWGAFMLEFFFGMEFGVGYFYLGYTTLGVLQLMLFFPVMIGYCCLACCCGVYNRNNLEQNGLPLLICGISSLFIWLVSITGWWIYAVIGMGTGIIPEANGAPTSEQLYL